MFMNFSETDINIIKENIEKSKVIVINQYKYLNKETTELYYIIIFEKTIMIINDSTISFLNQLILGKSDLDVLYLSDTKEILAGNSFNVIKIENMLIQIEISNFNNQFYYKNTRPISEKTKEIWHYKYGIICEKVDIHEMLFSCSTSESLVACFSSLDSLFNGALEKDSLKYLGDSNNHLSYVIEKYDFKWQ